MEISRAMTLGVVVERRRLDNPWVDCRYKPIGVLPGAAPGAPWRVLREGEGWTHFLAGSAVLELHRKDVESYKYNLDYPSPAIYVVLRPARGEHPYAVHLVTASPAEGDAYTISGDEMVEAVPMSEGLAAWIGAFIDAHYEAKPFYKRQRTKALAEEPQFGKTPIFARGAAGGGRDGG